MICCTALSVLPPLPFLQLLCEELAELLAASGKGWVALLKHVYKAHPPLDPQHR